MDAERRVNNKRNGFGIEQSSTLDQSTLNILECSICSSLLDDPRNCLNGHSYCYKCITHWLKINQSCPTCNCELKESNLGRNLFLQNYMSTLKISCKYSFGDDLCKEKILHPNLKKHEDECIYRFIDCKFNNDKCGQHRQKDIDNHYLVCQYRLVPCQACKSDIVFCELDEHMSTCDHVEIECDQCSIVVQIRNKKKHIDDDCPETLVDCTMEIDVCKSVIKRKDLKDHIQSSLVDHLVTKNQINQEKIIELEKTIVNLTKGIDDIRKSVSRHGNRILEIEIPIFNLTKGIDDIKKSTQLNINFKLQLDLPLPKTIKFFVNGIKFAVTVKLVYRDNKQCIYFDIGYNYPAVSSIDITWKLKLGWGGIESGDLVFTLTNGNHQSSYFCKPYDGPTGDGEFINCTIEYLKINKLTFD